ncbi:Transcription factor SKN7 [Tolypocladium ophioglossoides CBS 100239]|uniref:Transcription factor n=1 Tax=Tolypocladium ophioglossoides (strain CBS 100239) TaxID=1163406 RepID=A0A0L0NFZ1_TOLOC|nr:Transcription factor SKN7 [Tolypocladium ophioglossoides CBS 100239]
MSGTEMAAASGGGNNASEFVRKLFRMLEDPSHQDVARWGKDGDTFVVVEGEKFTRSILPKHFKHSNMSSFIRQLNKYDFHKVKPSSDIESSNPNGNILEFKHPYFRADSKDGLDNIRRKAPAPRKPPAAEDFTTTQHVSVISEQLTATQQQVQQLQELYTDVSQTNRLLVNEVLTLQKMLNAQKQSQYEMLNYLAPYNDGRSRGLMNSNGTGDVDDSVPELRRARELLSSVATDSVADRELERLHGMYGSPAESAAMITPATMPMLHDPMNDLSRYPVYPVGQTVGIDPFHSDHIHKIPYAMPNEGASVSVSEPPASIPAPTPTTTAPASSTPMDKSTSLWGPKKPHVFLVEDDSTCAKIGIKFLKSMGCEVEHAVSDERSSTDLNKSQNGADAYSRVSTVGRDHFDMMFMDIIMPRLDGVSATMYIRQHCPSTPIIAMTSNIRPDEVNGYFEHGMNGVLAKPFTKEGMLKSIKTHMSHLLKNPPAHAEGENAGYMMGNVPFLNNNIKFETSTPPPGASGSSWSPGHMAQNSAEQCYGFMNGGNQYGMGRPSYGAAMDSTSGRMSDHESPPEKRQRMNAPQGNYG